jgi:hypothetical protein
MDTNGARAYTTPSGEEPSPQEMLNLLLRQIGELQTYFRHFVSAKVDSVVLSARQLAMWTVLGLTGLLALAGLVVTAIVLLLQGAASGLALLFHTQLWLGQIVVGGGMLLVLTLGILIGMRSWQRQWREQKVQQYDERQLQQRQAFGHSVADHATTGTALRH